MNKETIKKYLSSHLQPINFIEEYHKKTLPVSILFYKVVKSFPKEKIGSMKGAFKHIHQSKFNHLSFFLSDSDISEIVKNQNNLRPKNGQYIEFLTLSLLNSCFSNPESLNFPNFQEDISEGWDFSIKQHKFDITSNPNKITRKDIYKIYIPECQILDKQGLVLPDMCLRLSKIMSEQNIELNSEKIDFCNLIINKIRNKYIENYLHKFEPLPQVPEILIKKEQSSSILVPNFNDENLETTKISLKTSEVSYEDVLLLDKIKQLSPAERSSLSSLLDSFISKKQ